MFSGGSHGAGLHIPGGENKSLNNRFADMNPTKVLEVDYEDRVACNCSLLEVVPVYEASTPGQPRDTIFMGTYDGHLYAMRMTVQDDKIMGSSQENISAQRYLLLHLKKWNFSGLVLSMISFSALKPSEDIFSKSHSKYGTAKTLGGSSSSSTFQTTMVIGGGTSARTMPTVSTGMEVAGKRNKSQAPTLPQMDYQTQKFFEFMQSHQH
jgi:hypothetical protein